MKYDYDGSGVEREIACSAYTVMLYEQTFKIGLIEDVYGRVQVSGADEDGSITIADFSHTRWGAYVRALWAMLKTGAALAQREHRPYENVPNFDTWSVTATNLDVGEIYALVNTRIQEDLFRAGTAAAKEGAAAGIDGVQAP